MEYATAVDAQSIQKTPELGRLKAAAERVARATNNVENFLQRFHGPSPTSGAATGGGLASDNYRNDLDSLFSAIDQLEGAVSALDRIG